MLNFVHVQLEELHELNAVLAVPANVVNKLENQGLVVYRPDCNPPWVSTSNAQSPVPGDYTDDLLYQLPGAVIIRGR